MNPSVKKKAKAPVQTVDHKFEVLTNAMMIKTAERLKGEENKLMKSA